MDSQDYLNQISASVRPVKPKSGISNIFSSAYFKWGLGALALLIVIIIFGSMLGGKTTTSERCISLKLHIDNTSEVINSYQPLLKSSKLRSLSSSLRSVLISTSSNLTTYMVSAQKYDEKRVKENVLEEADLNREALLEELFSAKINGLLDRTYAHKITLEIYTIMSDEAGIINSAAGSEAELKSLLTSSYDSLNNLYTEFNDFSETINN